MMVDKIFDGIRCVTTWIDRAACAEFNVLSLALEITIRMATAVGKCFWLAVLSFTKWPWYFADAFGERYSWRM